MEFRILGPVEVFDDAGAPVAVGGVRERAVLALLLLSAGDVVSADRLIDGIWGQRRTNGSLHALRVHVSRLRRALRSAARDDLLLTRPAGYALRVSDRDTFDAAHFDDLVRSSRRLAAGGDDASAATTLRQALALWRGSALAGLADAPFVSAQAARLEEMRLAAVEERIEHDLACGRHTELVGELEQLTADHPFRERIWGARMLALYRCGRQADALRAYDDLRALLRDQLGLDPSAAVTELHQAVLRHEPRLDMPRALAARVPSSATADTEPPTTRYAKRDGVNIAYQVLGDGPVDVVLVPGFVSNVDQYWNDPGWRQIFERITAARRLILWDKRGTGQSDPVHDVPTLDDRVEDLLAVMDAAGSERATLVGISEGGPMSLLLAATHPERVNSLILYGVSPRFSQAPGWPWGWTEQTVATLLAEIDSDWGSGALLAMFAPTRTGDAAARAAWGRSQRAGASPAMARATMEAMVTIDCRDVLPAIDVPTLVLHRPGDLVSPLPAAHYMADRIRTASLVEVPGDNHLLTFGAVEPLLDEIERFLDGPSRSDTTARSPATILSTILTVELVDATAAISADAPAVLHWSEPYLTIARREIDRHGGREFSIAETRLHVIFTAPSRAVSCAMALGGAMHHINRQVKAGVHTGECRLADEHGSEPLVHLCSQVAAQAPAGEVLVTAAVMGLLAGSPMAFSDRGMHSLAAASPGIHLYAAIPDPASRSSEPSDEPTPAPASGRPAAPKA